MLSRYILFTPLESEKTSWILACFFEILNHQVYKIVNFNADASSV